MDVNEQSLPLSEGGVDGLDLSVVVVVGSHGVGAILSGLLDLTVHVNGCSGTIDISVFSSAIDINIIILSIAPFIIMILSITIKKVTLSIMITINIIITHAD